MRTCKICDEVKSQDEFSKAGRYYRILRGDELQRYRPECKKCHSKRLIVDKQRKRKEAKDGRTGVDT